MKNNDDKMMETKKEKAVHAKIRELLVLGSEEKKLCMLAAVICKKLNTRNMRVIKNFESKLEARPNKPNQQLKLAAEKLKKDNEAIKALASSFSDFNASINSEIGLLTNEAGSLAKLDVVKKSAREEANFIKKQEALVSEMKKQLRIFLHKAKQVAITAK